MLSLFLSSPVARAQSNAPKVELGAQFSLIRLRDFSTTDPGVGGRITFNATNNLAFEGEINFFPKDLTKEFPFSSRRTEGLFGLKAGLRSEKLGIFGKIRPGFMHFNEAREAVFCILIFPPPLECALSTGKTEFALDFGGVGEFYPTRRTVVRFDLGDTMIRFDGPVLVKRSGPLIKDFSSHNLQFNIGIAVRF